MFIAYCDNEPFYAPNVIDKGLKLTSAIITYEINKAGSFEFTIPPLNTQYNAFKKLMSVITVKEDGKEIWRGRPLDTRRDFYNNKKIMCEGELAYLNDGLALAYDFTEEGKTVDYMFRTYYEHYYNDNVTPESRAITMGNITAVDPNTIVKIKSDVAVNILSDITDNFVNKFGGCLKIRHSNDRSYLDYLDISENISDQVIEFGRNLLNFEEYIDASAICTAIIPLGKQQEDGVRVNVVPIINKYHVDYPASMNLYGRIEQCIVYDDIDDPQELYNAAWSDLEKAMNEAVSINISAVDLKALGVNTNRIEVGQYVRVISKPHGVDSYFLCSKIELNLLNAGISTYTFGASESSLIDSQISINKISQKAYDIATGENQYIITQTTQTITEE